MNTGSRTIAMKNIRGKLVPSNTDAATVNWNRQNLYRAFMDHGLQELVSSNSSSWNEDGITFNSLSPIRINDHHDALTFITKLDDVMKTQSALELRLNGSFMVIADTGKEPLVFSVKVSDGEVSYREAKYLWSEDTKP